MFEQFAQHTIEEALREAIEQVDEEKISKSVLAPIYFYLFIFFYLFIAYLSH